MFCVGPIAVYEGKSLTEQTECPHPFESLQWNPNQPGMYDKCSLCEFESVIAYNTSTDDDEVKHKLQPTAVHVVETSLGRYTRQVHVASRALLDAHAHAEERTTDAETSLVYAVAHKG